MKAQLSGGTDLIVSLEDGKDGRIVNVYFFLVSCESVFSGILGRSFLTTFSVVAFLVEVP